MTRRGSSRIERKETEQKETSSSSSKRESHARRARNTMRPRKRKRGLASGQRLGTTSALRGEKAALSTPSNSGRSDEEREKKKKRGGKSPRRRQERAREITSNRVKAKFSM